MIRRTTLSHIVLAGSALLASACTLEKTDDAEAYREALPQAETVRVDGPDSAASAGRRLAASEVASAPEAARWYAFTREVRDGVNVVTAAVLGSVAIIVHSQPTTVEASAAEWGPHTDALEPVTWRFRVERVAEHTYDYRLEGRPRASRSESDYRAVLTGTGYDKADPRHGDGSFTIDLDEAKKLDPLKHRNESGKVAITHDLPHDIGQTLNALPRTIRAEVDPEGDAWFDIVSTANADQTGEIVVDSHGDIDESKATLAEDVHVQSRWRDDGAGRADIAITGGDLPATIPLVTATECWGTDFARAYYADSVGYEATEGEPSVCAYADPENP